MPDFEDLALCELLNKVDKRVITIVETRNVSQFKDLGADIQNVYNFVITVKKTYEEQQPMLKNLFSSFNYAAVIINDAIKTKKPDAEAATRLNEGLEIISACCK
ncbi:MAG: calponin homology domain-containing protein, partial [Clostridia bacterium]|nr:calponin homology domain-containing protein [Clostridia bacterium]